MSSLQVCNDTSEAVELCEIYGLYLKPLVKVNICVQLPSLKTPGQSISSWEVMEKLKKMIKSDEFISLKVSKTSLEFIRFEGELEKKSSLKNVLLKLESSTMKLSGFPDVLKIRAAPAKLYHPARHDWDSFFRDAKNVDEMKPGERPDTVYVRDLPSRWFANQKCDPEKPSEHVLKKVFGAFGDIRRVEIPSKSFTHKTSETFGKINNFSFSQELVFEAYVQYKEYMGFVKAMDSLRGMKLVYKSSEGKAHSADMKVDFDRTNYLSDRAIRKRHLEQEKLAQEKRKEHVKEKELSVQSKVKQSATEEKTEATYHFNTFEIKRSRKDKRTEVEALETRKNEAANLLKHLLNKSEIIKREKEAKRREEQIEKERLRQKKLLERRLQEEIKRKEEEARQKQELLKQQEQLLRERLLKALKTREERRTEELREKLRKELAGRNILKSVLVPAGKRHRGEEPSPKIKSFCTRLP